MTLHLPMPSPTQTHVTTFGATGVLLFVILHTYVAPFIEVYNQLAKASTPTLEHMPVSRVGPTVQIDRKCQPTRRIQDYDGLTVSLLIVVGLTEAWLLERLCRDRGYGRAPERAGQQLGR